MFKFEAVDLSMKKLLYLFLFTLILVSCKKGPTTWDIDTLVPLMHTKMDLQQAVPDSLISVNPNGGLNLIYKGELINFKLDSILELPDTTTKDEFILPFDSITLQPGQVFFSDSNFSRYEIGNTKLTQINIGTGNIILELSSTLNEAIVMEYSFPTITKNGVPLFIKERILAGSPNAPSTITKTINLNDYVISLTGLNNDNFNIISTDYKAYIDPNGNPVKVVKDDNFTISNTLSSIKPSYVRGSFGTEIKNESSINQIEAFNHITEGVLNLDEATLDFNIQNQVGVDLSLNVKHITGTSLINNTFVELKSPTIESAININRAKESNGIFSNPKPSQYYFELNKGNSNVSEFISNLPQEVYYDFELTLNPLGNVSSSNDFLYNQTGLAVNLDAKIPLKLHASNLTIIDTTSFSVDSSSQEDAKKIIGGYINMYASNWYPFDLKTQFYMLNDKEQIIDSIFQNSQVLYGAKPLFGVVDQPTESQIQAPITDQKIDHIYQTKSIISKISINSTVSDTVFILDYYSLDVRLVGDFKYLISLP